MRQQLLHGYMLHQRPYRENSRLVQFFSLEYGRVDGVSRQVPPLYQPVLLYASGKSALKTLSKLEWVGQPQHLTGTALFAGFYANELLIRLLPLEEPLAPVFAAYGQLLAQLQQLPAEDIGNRQLMRFLRQFEGVLLQELGYAIHFDYDVLSQSFLPDRYYRYEPREGFSVSNSGELGQHLLDIQQMADITLANDEQIATLTRVYRKALAILLGDKPLKSRELWISSQQRIHSQISKL